MNDSVATSPDHLLDVRDLRVYFPLTRGLLSKVVGHVKAVDGVSFSVRRGEVFALVGESGCGKTTTAMSVLNLTQPTSGSIELFLSDAGKSAYRWNELGGTQQRALRKKMQIIFQDPFSSLDPRMTVRGIIEEPLVIHGMGNKSRRSARLSELLGQVGLSESYLSRYPHEFSGGQRQRIGIARALATSPEFVIADEPVSALDVSIQAQIINLLQDLQQQYNQTMLFISHDLAVVRHLANRLAVMYQGRIMEMGTGAQIFDNPLHPYTHLLLESVPAPGKKRGANFGKTDETKASQVAEDGCPFYPRCPRGTESCLSGNPPLRDMGGEHLVACIHA